MSDFDFLEPIPRTTVSVKLPSRGVPYRKDTPASAGKVTMTPMTMVEEAIFAETDLVTAVDRALRRCVQDNLDINTLISADKFFLFMMLRAITYGPDYAFSWNCEGCGAANESTIKIPDDFQVKYLADEDTPPYQVDLPDSKKQIAFRLFYGHDEPMVERYRKEILEKKADGIRVPDTTEAYRLSRHIVMVDGKETAEAPAEMLVQFVSSLSAKDRQTIQSQISFYTPGLDTGVKLTCDSCGRVHDWEMPLTASFFRAVLEDEGTAMDDEI